MQVIASNPALGARALQDLLAAEQVVAAAMALLHPRRRVEAARLPV
jgi:hypothetical protein